MSNLKAGDCIDCLVREHEIISPYDTNFDSIVTFEIVANYDHGYFIYVPSHLWLKNTVKVDERKLQLLGISNKFLGAQIIHIYGASIYKVKNKMDGMCCKNCLDFFYMASGNQADGTLICWSCRRNPYR